MEAFGEPMYCTSMQPIGWAEPFGSSPCAGVGTCFVCTPSQYQVMKSCVYSTPSVWKPADGS